MKKATNIVLRAFESMQKLQIGGELVTYVHSTVFASGCRYGCGTFASPTAAGVLQHRVRRG